VEDADVNMFYFLTSSKNKQFCSFLMYAYSKLIHEVVFLDISVNICTHISYPIHTSIPDESGHINCFGKMCVVIVILRQHYVIRYNIEAIKV